MSYILAMTAMPCSAPQESRNPDPPGIQFALHFQSLKTAQAGACSICCVMLPFSSVIIACTLLLGLDLLMAQVMRMHIALGERLCNTSQCMTVVQ